MATILLPDTHTRDDLRVYLQRLLKYGEAEVRIQTRGDVLAVYGCLLVPAGLGDVTVLVMRGFALGAAPPEPIDATVQARSIIDRLARDEDELSIPPFEVMVPWAGVLPPTVGWEVVGAVDAHSLAAVAKEGVERVAAALPDQPGEAVVQRVRAEVWGAEIAPGVPAGAAFAADAMGFLGETTLRLARSRAWIRLTSNSGNVLVRM